MPVYVACVPCPFVQFVPDLSHIIPFMESATGRFTVDAVPVYDEDGFEVTTGAAAGAATGDSEPEKPMSEETIAAATILDSVLKNLTDNFSSTADYFKVWLCRLRHVQVSLRYVVCFRLSASAVLLVSLCRCADAGASVPCEHGRCV